ncbi:unnamed protein product [Microthlaspi erraticum]|uniref:Uncharacterized protein n=1 Tax=Microthlaspi erraticum TaxID=1685480 RepID=A0A6D2JVR6_9BRAS|nr:unnamed protein product [Microthlaspi erraticum]
MTHVIPIPLNAHPIGRLPPSMWCSRAIGYNPSYPLRCWVLLSDWSALDPIRFCISPIASHPLLKLLLSLSSWCCILIRPSQFRLHLSPQCLRLIGLDDSCLMSSWVSLPDSIRSSWSLSTPSLLFSSWCRCPIGLACFVFIR